MFTFRNATPDDADQIAKIVIENSDGVVEHILDKLVPGLSASTILSSAFMKGEGPYSTENVICSSKNDSLTSLLFSYPSYEHKIPALMKSFVPAKRLNPVTPILEGTLPDSLHINTFWREESLRGSGQEKALMVEAHSRCQALGFSKMVVFCWNDDELDMRFFAQQGFSIAEHLPLENLPLKRHVKGGSILCKNV